MSSITTLSDAELDAVSGGYSRNSKKFKSVKIETAVAVAGDATATGGNGGAGTGGNGGAGGAGGSAS